jgi:hypothetical protein
MEKDEKDFRLKMKVLEIVAHEMVYDLGRIEDIDKFFDRARLMYDTACKQDVVNWASPWSKGAAPAQEKPVEQPKPEPKPEIKKVAVPKNMKQCPQCGEVIPAGWKKHDYMRNGKKCGHVFEDTHGMQDTK